MARNLNALIVDDSPTTRKMIMQSLGQTGLAEFKFTEAGDGQEALDTYAPNETEIVFVDMNMPRMDGLEFVRQLRKLHKKPAPTVMITGETNRGRLSEALGENGVDAFLLKPVDRDRLQDGLRKLIDSIPERNGRTSVPHGACVPMAVEEVLAEACDLHLTREPSDPYIRSSQVVIGMVALHGSVHWSISLGFPAHTAALVASRFAGCTIERGDDDLGDAIGELVNIIAGRIKRKLGTIDMSVTLHLPTVFEACDFEILLQHTVVEYTHFQSPAGRFWCTVAVGMGTQTIL